MFYSDSPSAIMIVHVKITSLVSTYTPELSLQRKLRRGAEGNALKRLQEGSFLVSCALSNNTLTRWFFIRASAELVPVQAVPVWIVLTHDSCSTLLLPRSHFSRIFIFHLLNLVPEVVIHGICLWGIFFLYSHSDKKHSNTSTLCRWKQSNVSQFASIFF